MKSSKSDNAKRTTRKSDPTRIGAPDPKQKVSTFTSFSDYKDHCVSDHADDINYIINTILYRSTNPCEETSGLLDAGHGDTNFWPHGDIKCEICSLSFALQKDYDWHKRFGHADISSKNNNDIYELYQEYWNS